MLSARFSPYHVPFSPRSTRGCTSAQAAARHTSGDNAGNARCVSATTGGRLPREANELRSFAEAARSSITDVCFTEGADAPTHLEDLVASVSQRCVSSTSRSSARRDALGGNAPVALDAESIIQHLSRFSDERHDGHEGSPDSPPVFSTPFHGSVRLHRQRALQHRHQEENSST